MIPLLRTLLGVIVGGIATVWRAVPHGPKKSSRRTFTRNAALGSVGIVLAELAAGTVYLLWPNKTGAFGQEITVAAENVPPVGGEPFRWVPGKFYLMHNDDGLIALYWKCVHLGCTVPWVAADGEFRCPCHGSVYDRTGVRTAGPAPRPLDTMAVTVDPDGTVHVDTGAIATRGGYDPSQSVPYTATA